MNFKQNGGTLLDLIKPNGYQKSRLSVKINKAKLTDSNYNLEEVNQIDELFFLDKETGMKINPTKTHTGFIIFGLLNFNEMVDGNPTYYDNFCISTFRNPCEAFKCGTTIVRNTEPITDFSDTSNYGKTVYDRFNDSDKPNINLNKTFEYTNKGKYVIQNGELLRPVHARVLESIFYTGDNTGITNNNTTRREIPDPDTREGFFGTFRKELRKMGYEILMSGITRDKEDQGSPISWKIKSGIINAFYYQSFCYGNEKDEEKDLYHRSAEDDAFFLNMVLIKLNKEQGLMARNTDAIKKLITQLQSDTYKDQIFQNNLNNNKKVWDTMKAIRVLIKTNTTDKDTMKIAYSRVFSDIRLDAKHTSSGLILVEMLEKLMDTSGIKTQEMSNMLEEYKYISSRSGKTVPLDESDFIDNGSTIKKNYSLRYLINRSKEKAGREKLNSPEELINRKSFDDCVVNRNFDITFEGKTCNYLFYMIKTHKYNISCPYGKIDSPTDDHVYFIDFENNCQRDIMFDGRSKCLNLGMRYNYTDGTGINFAINYETMRDMVNIYKTCTIDTPSNSITFSVKDFNITISKSSITYRNKNTKTVVQTKLKSMNELDLNNFKYMKDYLIANFDNSYQFNSVNENDSIISFLIHYKKNLRTDLASVDINYNRLSNNIKNVFNFQKFIFDLLFISYDTNNSETIQSNYNSLDYTSPDYFTKEYRYTNSAQESVYINTIGYWTAFFHSKIEKGYVTLDSSVFRVNNLVTSSIKFIPHTDKVYYACQYFLNNYKVSDIFESIKEKLNNANSILRVYDIAVLIWVYYDRNVDEIAAIFGRQRSDFEKKDIFAFRHLFLYKLKKLQLSNYFINIHKQTPIDNKDSGWAITNFRFNRNLVLSSSSNRVTPSDSDIDLIYNSLKSLYDSSNYINKLYITELLGLNIELSKVKTLEPTTIFKKYYDDQTGSGSETKVVQPFVILWEELARHMEYVKASKDLTKLKTIIDNKNYTGILTENIEVFNKSTTDYLSNPSNIHKSELQSHISEYRRLDNIISGKKERAERIEPIIIPPPPPPPETPEQKIVNLFKQLETPTTTKYFDNQCKPGFGAKRVDDIYYSCFPKTEDNIKIANNICKQYGILNSTKSDVPDNCGYQTGCKLVTNSTGTYCIPNSADQQGYPSSATWRNKYLKYKMKYQQLKIELNKNKKIE